MAVLALYDCRSKQEYIYRTNKIREISGGSQLLAAVYDKFIEKAQAMGISFKNNGKWEGLDFSLEKFSSGSFAAEVVYTGGGNLMVIYKDKDTYIRANRIFSRMLLDETFTITAIAACAEVTGDFMNDRAALYAHNARKKSIGHVSSPCSVLPFTQVDMQTYMPVAEKKNGESKSRESVCKLSAYEYGENQENELSAIYLDDIVTEKGKESLLAIIYIDGNNMGAKLMQAIGGKTGYDECINALRRFSEQTNKDFVDAPIKNIEDMLKKKIGTKKYAKYRKVIAGGDEITLICNARIAPDILDTYFKTLNSADSGNYACAGVAIFHSHAPFADVYEIAEQCCESGKKQSRKYGSNANFIDFHFCRAGITNDMETVRFEQENGSTARPYRVDSEHEGYSYGEFTSLGKMLAGSSTTDVDEERVTHKDNGIGRANVKALATALINSRSAYRAEMLRIRSRLNIKNKFDKELLDRLDPDDRALEKLIFDIAQVYDLWFDGENDTEAEI